MSFDEGSGGPSIGLRLLELYKSKLRAIGYRYVGDERVVRDPVRDAAYYILIFASNHERGEEFWTKVARDEPGGQRSFAY